MSLPRKFLQLDSVLGYVINAYAGTDPVAGNEHLRRRVWLWEADGEVKMGNTEAFVLHLGRHFGIPTVAADATALHALMRELGEALYSHDEHASPDPASPKAGQFVQPEPEEWRVGGKPRD